MRRSIRRLLRAFRLPALVLALVALPMVAGCALLRPAVTALDTVRAVVDDLDNVVHLVIDAPQVRAFVAAATPAQRDAYTHAVATYWAESEALHKLASAGDAANAGDVVGALSEAKAAWAAFVAGMRAAGVNVASAKGAGAPRFAAVHDGGLRVTVRAPIAAGGP